MRNEKLIKIFKDFGKSMADDLDDSFVDALNSKGRSSPQTTKMNFNPEVQETAYGVRLNIVAYDTYWRWVESGRKKGARRVPADKLSKKWQNKNGINAVTIIAEIQRKRLGYAPKKLKYGTAVKQLAFIIQKSIYKKGIVPKPFVDKIINDGRFEKFRNDLVPILGEHFKLVIKGLA
jgi:hypothetical protein